MTLEEYIAAKRKEVRNKALEKSRTRTEPTKSFYVKEHIDPLPAHVIDDTKKKNESLREEVLAAKMVRDRFKVKMPENGLLKYIPIDDFSISETARKEINRLNSIGRISDIEYINNLIRAKEGDIATNDEIIKNGGYVIPGADGLTCISTATDNYGKQYIVTGNSTFRENPGKYGFESIDISQIEPGDIVQHIVHEGNVVLPTHAMIYDGVDESGTPLFNHSSGGTDSSSIRRKAKYYPNTLPFTSDNYLVYRFIGNEDDNNKWTEEYNSMSSGGSINKLIELADRIKSSGYEYKFGGQIQKKQFDAGGLIEKYGADRVRQVLSSMRGQKRYDGLQEPTSTIQTMADGFGFYPGMDIQPSESVIQEKRKAKAQVPGIMLQNESQANRGLDLQEQYVIPVVNTTLSATVEETPQQIEVAPKMVANSNPEARASLSAIRKEASRGIMQETIIPQRDSHLIGRNMIDTAESPLQFDTDSGAVVIPDRDTSSYFMSKAERLIDEAIKFDYENKTKQQIIDQQQTLADHGYYTASIENLSKEQIKDIQIKLIQKGLLSNKKNSKGNYVEADGIVGDKTRAAYNKYNMDGIWGKRSEDAYRRMVKQNTSTDWSKSFSDGIDGCARWVTRKFESVMGNSSSQNGVVGNAWQMLKNIENKGGNIIYNLYDYGFDKVKTVSQLKDATEKEINSRPFDLSLLSSGDVVGIYFPNSTHHSDVLKEGTTYNTHVGIVSAFDTDGTPIIQHNMGGKERNDRADKLPWNSKITVAARPAGNGLVGEYPFKLGNSKYEIELPEKFESLSTEESKNNLKTFMDAMDGGAQVIGSIYNNANMDDVQKIAIGVLQRETGFMQNTESSRKGKAGLIGKAKDIAHDIVGTNKESRSSDLTKFKLGTLNQNERRFLGITSTEDLEKPEKAALASMYVLAKNYDYFSRYAKENPQLGITKQDIIDLTALSYNQGMSRLYSVGAAQFIDGTLRSVPSKLESLRNLANSEDVIDDFSATTPGRIAKNYPFSRSVMEFAYKHNLIGNKSTSYMNSAREAIQHIKEKRGIN